jgi:hypothetical protein
MKEKKGRFHGYNCPFFWFNLLALNFLICSKICYAELKLLIPPMQVPVIQPNTINRLQKVKTGAGMPLGRRLLLLISPRHRNPGNWKDTIGHFFDFSHYASSTAITSSL